MPRLLPFLFLSLAISSATIAVQTSSDDPGADTNVDPKPTPSRVGLHELLSQLDDSSVHDALQTLSAEFPNGVVLPTDTSALEALQSDEPSLASRVVSFARREAETGSNNSASASPSAAPTTTAEVSSSPPSTSAAPTSTEPSSTSAEPTSSSPSDSPSSTPTTSTSSSSSSSSSSASASPSTSASSTSSPATTSTTSSSSSSSSPSTSSPATTSSSSSTPVTSTYSMTTTRPDGSLKTVTQVAIVQPTQSSSSSAAANGQSTSGPGLQTPTSASPMRVAIAKEFMAVLSVAAVVAMTL